ncbi:MAG: hypothetical protein QM820_13300 [Minicystis sp.]
MTAPPAKPAVRGLLLAHLRGGAMAAGGSLLGLAGAMVLSQYAVPSDVQIVCWMVISLVSIGVAIRHGYAGHEGGLRVAFARALGVTVFGFAIGAAFVAPIAVYLPRGSDEPVAMAILCVAGVLLVAGARLTLPKVSFEEPIPDGPGGLLPAPPKEDAGSTYALAPTGPALTAAESERDDLAVEVRVLWGSDLVRVDHLSPPRRFHVGEAACDFVVDAEPLGTARFPLVVVEGDAVSVIAPRGAAGTIHTDGSTKRVTIDRAIAEGIAEPSSEVPAATKITLSFGTRVTLSLPSRTSALAYRAAHGPEDAAEARVVFEVALVRAGKVVGRGLSLRGRGRMLISNVVVASLLLGGMRWAAATMPVPDPDDDGPTSDQRYEMQKHLYAAIERMQENETPEFDPDLPNPPTTRTTGERTWRRGRWLDEEWKPEQALEGRPFAVLPEMEMFGPRVFCWSYEWDDEPFGRTREFGGPISTFCKRQSLTPFGLRMLGEPFGRDALGRDPSDHWLLELEDVRRRIHAAPATDGPAPRPQVTIEAVRGNAPEPVVAQARRYRNDMRACYELGLVENRSLEGEVNVALTVGVDGVAQTQLEKTTVPDQRVAHCVADVLTGRKLAPAPGPVVRTRLRVQLRLGQPQTR